MDPGGPRPGRVLGSNGPPGDEEREGVPTTSGIRDHGSPIILGSWVTELLSGSWF